MLRTSVRVQCPVSEPKCYALNRNIRSKHKLCYPSPMTEDIERQAETIRRRQRARRALNATDPLTRSDAINVALDYLATSTHNDPVGLVQYLDHTVRPQTTYSSQRLRAVVNVLDYWTTLPNPYTVQTHTDNGYQAWYWRTDARPQT